MLTSNPYWVTLFSVAIKPTRNKKGNIMKNFIVTIKIEGLTGTRTMVREIKAKTEKSALSKAYLIIAAVNSLDDIDV